MYPTISEYIESIGCAEDNFATLTNLRPILDGDGHPVMSVGNFAVVFKMRSEKDGRYYALKCFIKDQPKRAESYRLIADELEFVSSDYLVHVRYLEKELFVDSTASSDTEFPVLLMDWVDGVTLDKWVKQNIHSQHSLQLLTYQFCRMASWLMSQPFAHGDLKPDNIIVREDGTLVLVDYDGMYVPAMQCQKARELGSPDYRHPARADADFNEHIDDFSLAAIAMQLAAIAIDPGLFANQDGDTLLLTERDHQDLTNSSNHRRLHSLFHNVDFERLYALYHLAHAQQTLSNVSFRAFHFPKPEKNPEVIELSTEVTDEDIKNGVKDEFGALYSPDGLRLLRVYDVDGQYHIRQGTKVICDNAFDGCIFLASITIPDSVTHIGIGAFSYCWSLSSLAIPYSVTHIGTNPFDNSGVRRIKCDSLFFEVDDDALYTKGKKLIIALLNRDASEFTIPDSVTHISDCAFKGCDRLSTITIPSSVTHIGINPFAYSGIFKVECKSILFEVDDDALYSKGKKKIIAFFNKDASEFYIPDTVTHIDAKAFEGCYNLSSITIPYSVTHIGVNPFAYSGIREIKCESLSFEVDEDALYTKGKKRIITFFNKEAPRFSVPRLTHLSDSAFDDCQFMITVTIPDSVTHIGDEAFSGCENMSSIIIPGSVTHIGNQAFSGCKRLFSITIPNSVTHIGDSAFSLCDGLFSIVIPRGSRAKFEQILPNYLHILLNEQ